MKKLFYILLFTFSFSFYWVTGSLIENRTEAEDAFEYALMVERGDAHPWYYHQHHLLYGPITRGVYLGAQAVGYSGDAIHVMRLVSAFSAAGTLFFFFLFCYKRFSLRPISSLLSTAFLGVSYGFWRYSAESEIPLVASFLMTAGLYFGTDAEGRRGYFAWAIALSSLAVLAHVMNAVAVFAAIPCFYLLRRRWGAAAAHVVLCGGLVALVYSLISARHAIHVSGGSTRFAMLHLGAVVKAAVAFVQCVISCNFMLGFNSVRAFLGELFAGRMLLEEFYLGARLPRSLVLFSTLSFAAFLTFAGACVARAGWVWINLKDEHGRFKLPEGFAAVAVSMIWFVGYGGLLLLVEPGNPELWVMGLVPFALLLCGLVMLPLTHDNRLWLPFLMVIALLTHNGVAGLGVLRSSENDYQHQKAASVLDIAGEGDLVVTAGNPVFERYLRYHFAGEVVYLHNLSPADLRAGRVPSTSGETYVLNDVFSQPRSLRIRFPERTELIDAFAARIEPRATRATNDLFGGVWLLEVE